MNQLGTVLERISKRNNQGPPGKVGSNLEAKTNVLGTI